MESATVASGRHIETDFGILDVMDYYVWHKCWYPSFPATITYRIDYGFWEFSSIEIRAVLTLLSVDSCNPARATLSSLVELAVQSKGRIPSPHCTKLRSQ